MSVTFIREVLLWCSVINLGLLLLWFCVFSLAHDWVYRFHGKWFVLPKETFNAIHYAGMAFFKMSVLLFNVVPCIVLYVLK